MPAKEMFKKLGYEYTECWFCEELGEIYYEKNGIYTPQIKFSLLHKTISVYRVENKASSFDIKLLQAINKQVEELGWNNVSTAD